MSRTGSDAAEGISVIVCTCNGAGRIGKTLEHLARQEFVPVPWEVIVVDNGSTDDTVRVARQTWPTDGPTPLRLLYEPTPGYNHAAECGIANARGSVIVHVHDDNWLAPDWLARAMEIFRSDPAIGACGGAIEAAFDSPPPFWFERFRENYAVGAQAEQNGDITWSRGYLWGAGLCLGKRAWMELKDEGFRLLSSGRAMNGRLVSGEDTELCHALRLAGWKLWYSDTLRLTHYLPSSRLNWNYLRTLFRSFGEASVLHDCYRYTAAADTRKTWSMALFESLDNLVTLHHAWFNFGQTAEGDGDILQLERAIGRTTELWRMGRAYNETQRAIFDAQWRKIGPGRANSARPGPLISAEPNSLKSARSL